MRTMNLDPTYVPYLRQATGAQPAPIREQNVQERRARMTALRRAAAAPSDVRIEERRIDGPGGALRVRLYRPDRPGPLPTVLYYHGGGWMYGSPEQSDGTAIRFCRETGALVISPDYRLSPEHPFPAGFDDCYAALCWAAGEGAEHGVDVDRLAVMGESSGGNLAAACALAARDRNGPKLRLQVLNYPVLGLDFDTPSYRQNADAPILNREDMIYFWNAYLSDDLEMRDERATPLCATDLADLPAAVITTAEYDPLRDEGQQYAARLRQANVSVEVRNASRLPHGFMRAWAVSDDVQELAGEMIAALRQALAVD